MGLHSVTAMQVLCPIIPYYVRTYVYRLMEFVHSQPVGKPVAFLSA